MQLLMFSIIFLQITGCVLLITLVGIIIYYKWAFTYWKRRNAPYLEPSIPFGTMKNPLTNKINIGVEGEYHYNLVKSRGLKQAGIFILLTPKNVVVDLDVIKCILQKDFDHFTDREFYYNERDDPLSANLFALDGEKWRAIRTKLSPAFTSGKLKSMFEILLTSSYQLRDAIEVLYENKQDVNISDFSAYYSMDVIASCGFGLESNNFKNPNSKFVQEGKKIFDFTSEFRALKVFLSFSWPNFSRWLGITLFEDTSTEFFTNIVRETIKFRQTNNVVRNDIIQLLKDLKECETSNNKISLEDDKTIKEIAAQVFIFFAAGFETSSTTLTYCLYELAINPEIQDKLRREINENLAKHQQKIKYDSIMDMKYMDQVVDETLRKYPPVSFLSRVCTKEYKMPDTEIMFEKGMVVYIPVLGLHRDPDYYPEPDKFEPERFSAKNKKKRIPFTYLPFGEGPRICIGLRFGLMQIKVALAVLLRQYKFSLNSKTKIPIEFDQRSFTLTPKEGIYLDIEKIFIFRCLEHPSEAARLSRLNLSLKARRRHLVERIVNNTDFINLADVVSFELREYEKLLEGAFAEGIERVNHQEISELEKWTFLKSVFFSSTVLTTIGYGNIVPMTTGGRAFCMVFAMVGIPLTLTVIADMGRLFASSLSTLAHQMPGFCRNATVARRTSSYALAALCFLFVYLSAGAGLFVIWEDDWTFFDGFYFCFITMTTIGFGDLVPKKPKYMLICTLYILIGLALTSTIIELVRRQYLQSWKQLQAMSGPMAEALRKIADNAPGLDVTAFQNDLRKVLTVVTMPKKSANQIEAKGNKKHKQQDWEDAVEAVIRDITAGAKNKQPTPPVVQIVIYESSV